MPSRPRTWRRKPCCRAWKQAPRWTPGKAKFDTWLHRVALNLCYDRLRRRREVPTETLRIGPTRDRRRIAASWRLSSARGWTRRWPRLPERQREAIVLCHYQELTNIEAAGLMAVSVEALESLLSRGRRTLRQTLAHLAPGAEPVVEGGRG